MIIGRFQNLLHILLAGFWFFSLTSKILPVITLVGGELLSELPSTSPLVSEEDGGEGCPGFAVTDAIGLVVDLKEF